MKVTSLIAGLVLVASISTARAAIIAHWTFETSVPTTAGPHAAEAGDNAGAGSPASGFHAGAATVYSNPAGNGSAESFSSNTWATGDYYQFQTSTVGYSLIAIEWCQVRSSTGPADFTLEGSTDGSTFSSLLANYTVLSSPSWSSGTPQPTTCFSAVAAPASFDNQAAVYFRLTSNETPSNAGGTNRVDDVKIITIPEPTSLGLLAFGAVVALRRRR